MLGRCEPFFDTSSIQISLNFSSELSTFLSSMLTNDHVMKKSEQEFETIFCNVRPDLIFYVNPSLLLI